MKVGKFLTVTYFAVFASVALADSNVTYNKNDKEFIGYLHGAKKAMDFYGKLSEREIKMTSSCCDGPAPYRDCGGVPQEKVDRCSVLSKQRILLDNDTTPEREFRRQEELMQKAGDLFNRGAVSKNAIKEGANFLKLMQKCGWDHWTQKMCKLAGIDDF